LNYFHEQALVSAAQAQQASKHSSEGKGAVPNMDLSPMQSNDSGLANQPDLSPNAVENVLSLPAGA
jgi:hypothetical protein